MKPQGGQTMRVFLLLLLLANVAFFAWSRHLAPSSGISPENHLLQQQIQPEAIKLLPPESPEPSAQDGSAAALASKLASNGAPDAAASAASAESATPPVAGVCLEWGAFSPADVRAALEAVAAALPQARVAQRRVTDESGNYWVFIPPQATRQGALQKVGELRRLGVEEMFIVQEDSKYRFAVSLGVFRTQEAARNHLEKLRAQGVRTAQVAPRDTSAQRVFLQVRGTAETVRAGLAAMRPEYPGTSVQSCGAGNRAGGGSA